MTEHSGTDWIKTQLPYVNKDRKGVPANPNAEMSPLGEAVATLLGELFYGIYHLDPKALFKVDWRNAHHIEFSLGWHELATTDYSELSRLVFLAHHLAIRVSIEASTRKYLKLTFHQRSRNGSLSVSHPTLDQAVEMFKAEMVRDEIPEYMMGKSPIEGAVNLLIQQDHAKDTLLNRDNPEWRKLHDPQSSEYQAGMQPKRDAT